MGIFIKSYFCDPDLFYAEVDPDHARRAEVQETMNHLADCYRLDGKTVMSVGAGRACEEYHLLQRGCRLRLFDNNGEGTVAEPIRKSAVEHQTSMLYTLGDFRWFKKRASADVLYFSGYYPDEVRRDFIYRKLPGSHALKWSILGPFSRSLIAALDMLNPGGLLLIQSYYGGVEIVHHEDYISACVRQLARHGVTLLDVFCFEKTTGIKLFAAVKGHRYDRDPISTFHGRANNKETIIRVY